ncbi:sensor domain-containing diguanylate cyclase [Methylorubrum salsuginis]|uniref:Diguanylate cyclase (GGDEF) domain-containing protein n=1 Tax=Methylorubrum salsuginis TaxID=414703 RepID=A0A1I4J4Y3_9HYPH|nr:sensor domain-containing diguanylate cyclase [Methylorubrum salsuginis]SFL61655.1 diguanylate cyclase (GGDEF) domain-containing protein [Methylorubrum salsuginis]
MPDAPRIRGISEAYDPAEIERLRLQLRIQSAIIAAQRDALQNEALADRAMRGAQMGLWECSLPDERVRWTQGVYDLFGLSPEAPLVRQATLEQYTPDSRRTLTLLRDQALANGTGFKLDAEIRLPDGRHRWLRLTATVDRREGIPIRLFGLKQDVTDEILLLERTRQLAETDALTGLANRARFDARLRVPVGTLLLIDLDGFKAINDAYGHPAGDACLREAGSRLMRTCRRGALVARLGGDEFAVVLDESLRPDAAAALAQRIVEALGRPVDHEGRRYRLGASVGVALSGSEAGDLFARADTALYAAKAAGRRTFRLFDPAACPPGRAAGWLT